MRLSFITCPFTPLLIRSIATLGHAVTPGHTLTPGALPLPNLTPRGCLRGWEKQGHSRRGRGGSKENRSGGEGEWYQNGKMRWRKIRKRSRESDTAKQDKQEKKTGDEEQAKSYGRWEKEEKVKKGRERG